MLIGDEPRNITVSHNTVDSNGNALTYTYGGTSADPREIYGLEMVANASRHGSYGINGAILRLRQRHPQRVTTREASSPANYLAGASLSRYPAGTLVAGLFQDQFVNPSGGDYTVRPGSILKGAAPDGTDIGADFPMISAKVAGVVAGIIEGVAAAPAAGQRRVLR